MSRQIFLYGISAASILLFTSLPAFSQLYKNPDAPIEARVTDLLGRMTLEEKVLQLTQYTLGRNNNANNLGEKIQKMPAETGSLIYYEESPSLRNRLQRKAVEESRLGIPILFGFDAIHGFRTVYPIPLAQACAWNPSLVKEACAVSAREARMSGVDWTFSPMIDVARDPRWGRVAEGYGEDPYVNGVFAAASVSGYQGEDLRDGRSVASCLKHYVGYGASEAGRDYVYTEISRQTLWDTYLPPYEWGVKAGAASVMSAFNDISGTPATANAYTLSEVLKNRWKFDGLVVSDWDAVKQLVTQGFASSPEDAAMKAIHAGLDIDMISGCYHEHLAGLVQEGKVTMEEVDEAVRRVLRLKFRLGLFEHPYTPESAETERFLLPASKAAARQLAEESMVLLKNERNTLPLSSAPATIAVVGPLAKEQRSLLGSWAGHGRAEDVTSLWDGFKKGFPKDHRLLYAKGCNFDGDDSGGFAEALSIAGQSDIILLCLGEKHSWSGENASRSTIALPAIQERLAEALKKTGKPIVLILSNGRPLELCRLEPLCDAILEIWQPGIAGGEPVADILTGGANPSGKLAMTFPYSTGQIPIYYNRRQSARPQQGLYQDETSNPLYPFGHGLSYTSFRYGAPTSSASVIGRSDTLQVRIEVTNTGQRDGLETVHWYVSAPCGTVTRPARELKYFEKKLVKAGETKTFSFAVCPERDFSYTDSDGQRFVENGEYTITVGGKQTKITVTQHVAGPTHTALQANHIFVEAESFAEKGGWKTDQQFMDQMGSPYLLAHGMGIPVADAKTHVRFPAPGIYYAYVRTYNWTSPWSAAKGPGKFRLSVNGKQLDATLGDTGDRWMWQEAGKVHVKSADATVTLHDLTGFDGRCDALYFTTRRGALPPSDSVGLAEFRRQALRLPDTPPTAGKYDLVVVGGGIAGISAAVAAARLGCKVALLNDRPVLGGNNSSEIRVHLGGRIEVAPYPALGGLQKEFGPSKVGNAQPAENYEDRKKLDVVLKEKNIDLFLNYRGVAAGMDGKRIANITAKHIETGKELLFEAPLFADCTGDGTIGYLAGADWRMGREARSEFGEDLAPGQADNKTLGSSVQWYSVETQKNSRFPLFEYGIKFNETNAEQTTKGEWTWETGMNQNQIDDFERIRDYGLLVIYSNWSFLKNRLKRNEAYRNRRLGWVAYIAGKRESRRLLGDYILKEDDIRKNVFHEDASFTTTWSIDLHWEDPDNSRKFPGREFKSVTEHILIYPYAVPYRCLYSRNIENLFMAGRDISATHVALGTIRVMRTTGMMGEVVGMAASLCKRFEQTPRGIYQHHLADLKTLMTRGVGGDGFPNNQRYNEGGRLKDKPRVLQGEKDPDAIIL